MLKEISDDEVLAACVVCLALMDSIESDIIGIKIDDDPPGESLTTISKLTKSKIDILSSILEQIRDRVPLEFEYIKKLSVGIMAIQSCIKMEESSEAPSPDNQKGG